MEREELDPKILPKEQQHPDLVMAHVYIFGDEQAPNDCTVYFITNATSDIEYIRGVLLKGELVWYQTSDQPK